MQPINYTIIIKILLSSMGPWNAEEIKPTLELVIRLAQATYPALFMDKHIHELFAKYSRAFVQEVS